MPQGHTTKKRKLSFNAHFFLIFYPSMPTMSRNPTLCYTGNGTMLYWPAVLFLVGGPKSADKWLSTGLHEPQKYEV